MKRYKREERVGARGVVLCGTSLRRTRPGLPRPPVVWSKQGKESGRAAHVSQLSRRCRVIDSKLSASSTNQTQAQDHMGWMDQWERRLAVT